MDIPLYGHVPQIWCFSYNSISYVLFALQAVIINRSKVYIFSIYNNNNRLCVRGCMNLLNFCIGHCERDCQQLERK